MFPAHSHGPELTGKGGCHQQQGNGQQQRSSRAYKGGAAKGEGELGSIRGRGGVLGCWQASRGLCILGFVEVREAYWEVAGGVEQLLPQGVHMVGVHVGVPQAVHKLPWRQPGAPVAGKEGE
jgi:hypothetical protein